MMSNVDSQALYRSLWDRKEETEGQAIEAANALWKFMDDRADRASEKPYEICGATGTTWRRARMAASSGHGPDERPGSLADEDPGMSGSPRREES